MRFKLLSRNAHSEHVDGEYCARILKNMRFLAVELKLKLDPGSGIFIHGDDKSSFKIGDPGDGLAVVERSKGSWDGKRPVQSSQHDFATFKGNPSVWLVSDIPDDPSESFYRGHVYVSVKDAVFEPSTPLRHATEMFQVLKHHYQKHGGEATIDTLKVLLLYTDGGPDHNVKFATVWLVLICLFRAADLDFLIASRTCPTMSWKNVVEKIMCVLNLALYGVTLVRSQMGDMEDAIVKASGSMAKIRAAAADDPDLLDACKLSIQPVKDLLHSRFQKLDLKGKAFGVFEAASKNDLLTMLSFAFVVDSQLPGGEEGLSLKSNALHKQAAFNEFVQSHFSVRDYFVVLGKYCQEWQAGSNSFVKKFDCDCCKPVKMSGEIWEDLSTRDPLLPDPEPMGGEWLQYADLIALRKTSPKYQPSLTQPKQAALSEVPNRRKLTKAETVRSFVKCCNANCGKLRCVYSLEALSPDEAKQFVTATQDVNYYCGSQPLPPRPPVANQGETIARR